MDDFTLFLDSLQLVGANCLSTACLGEARRRSRWPAICWDGTAARRAGSSRVTLEGGHRSTASDLGVGG